MNVREQIDERTAQGPRPRPLEPRAQLSAEPEYRQPWDVFKSRADREAKMAAAQSDSASASTGTMQED